MKKVIDFLKENYITTVATSYNDKPRASIVEYYMVGDSIIFCTERDSVKAMNLKHNKNISISVSSGTKYATVDGFVEEPTRAEIEDYNKQIIAKHPKFKDMIEKGEWSDTAYFKVVPQTAYLSGVSTDDTMILPEVFKA